MSTIRIGTAQRNLEDAAESWINQQVNERNEHGQPVCVQLALKSGSVDLILTTPACAGTGGGGGRPPNSKEQEIFSLWDKRGLNQQNWSSGNLIAFLKQLHKFL